jgi:nitrite reductase/ring-hydroxylating ferredoxin subunit
MDWIRIFLDEADARNKIQNNKPQLLIVNGIRICLTLHNNTFFAVQDACTHQGESLSKGAVNYLGELICPLHNYRFDLQNGRECATRSRNLKTFPIKADESGIFIGL